jgi:Domain of Unknown Function (DUF1259)
MRIRARQSVRCFAPVRERSPACTCGATCGALRLLLFGLAFGVLCICGRVRADAPATQPVVDTSTIDAAIGVRGTTADDVYCVEVPRKDIHLTIDGADVPTAAGIASHFYFYTCPCGKTRVIGEFVLCDYESDDVVDALHEGWLIKVDAISPMLNEEKPRLRIVRFHGEGSADAIAKHIRAALDQTGEARTK